MNSKLLKRQIRKLYASAGNNPSEAEAIAVALKVGKLLREHNLTTYRIAVFGGELVPARTGETMLRKYRVTVSDAAAQKGGKQDES